jgi:hypothetical protein
MDIGGFQYRGWDIYTRMANSVGWDWASLAAHCVGWVLRRVKIDIERVVLEKYGDSATYGVKCARRGSAFGATMLCITTPCSVNCLDGTGRDRNMTTYREEKERVMLDLVALYSRRELPIKVMPLESFCHQVSTVLALGISWWIRRGSDAVFCVGLFGRGGGHAPSVWVAGLTHGRISIVARSLEVLFDIIPRMTCRIRYTTNTHSRASTLCCCSQCSLFPKKEDYEMRLNRLLGLCAVSKV